jgi:hypothetical protein
MPDVSLVQESVKKPPIRFAEGKGALSVARSVYSYIRTLKNLLSVE